MIFLTVGSMFPFDRLVRAVDELVGQGEIREPVFAQIGDGRFEPRNMPFERFVDKTRYEQHVRNADTLIGHAGAGTIELALLHGKALLVLPRAKRFGEHVNDHQLATARKFEALGHVMVAYDTAAIAAGVRALAKFRPRPRVADRERMARRVGQFIDEVNAPSRRTGDPTA